MAECDCAVDGVEGLEAFIQAYMSGSPYDLICLDLLMPRMNGYNTLREIREFEKKEMVSDEKRVRVIVITCVDDGQSKKTVKETGCEAYMIQPVLKSQLYETIEDIGLF